MNSKPVGATVGGGEDYILIRDEKTTGSHGGSFTASAWRTRTLNTIVKDDGGHASLNANQITLAAGTYRVRAHAPAVSVLNHKAKLYNITDAVDAIIGSTELAHSSYSADTQSFIEGPLTLAAPKLLEVQHRCAITKGTTGFGNAAAMGVVEVYTVIEFFKEA